MARHGLLTAIQIVLLCAARHTCRADHATLDESGNIEKDVLVLTDKTVNATIEEGHSLLLVRPVGFTTASPYTEVPSRILSDFQVTSYYHCFYCRRYTLRGVATAR